MAGGSDSVPRKGSDPHTLDEAAEIAGLTPDELIELSVDKRAIRICVRVPGNVSVFGLHPGFRKLQRDVLADNERAKLEVALLEKEVAQRSDAAVLYPFPEDVREVLRFEEEYVSLFQDAAGRSAGEGFRPISRPLIMEKSQPGQGMLFNMNGVFATFPKRPLSRSGKGWQIHSQESLRITKKSLLITNADLKEFLDNRAQDVTSSVRLLDGYQSTNCDRLEFLWAATFNYWGPQRSDRLTIEETEEKVVEFLMGSSGNFQPLWAEVASALILPRYARGISSKKIPGKEEDFVSDELKVITNLWVVVWGDEAYMSDGPYYSQEQIARFLVDWFSFSVKMARYSAMIIRPDEGIPSGSGPRPKARKPRIDIAQQWKLKVGKLPASQG